MNKAICIRKYLNFFERHKLYLYKKEDDTSFDKLITEYKVRLKIPKSYGPIPQRFRRITFIDGSTMVVSMTREAFKYHFREFL